MDPETQEILRRMGLDVDTTFAKGGVSNQALVDAARSPFVADTLVATLRHRGVDPDHVFLRAFNDSTNSAAAFIEYADPMTVNVNTAHGMMNRTTTSYPDLQTAMEGTLSHEIRHIPEMLEENRRGMRRLGSERDAMAFAAFMDGLRELNRVRSSGGDMTHKEFRRLVEARHRAHVDQYPGYRRSPLDPKIVRNMIEEQGEIFDLPEKRGPIEWMRDGIGALFNRR